MKLDPQIAKQDFCYVTTTGRVTGRPHTIEIWFAAESDTLYILSGGRDASDWVKNAKRHPGVSVRIAKAAFEGTARMVDNPSEDALARRLLLEKYAPGYSGDLDEWGRTALPVAIDVRT